jgi:hypothetical protein
MIQKGAPGDDPGAFLYVIPVIECVRLNSTVPGQLRHGFFTLNNQLDRFDLELSGGRLPPLNHCSLPGLVRPAFRTVRNFGEYRYKHLESFIKYNFVYIDITSKRSMRLS